MKKIGEVMRNLHFVPYKLSANTPSIPFWGANSIISTGLSGNIILWNLALLKPQVFI